MVDLIFGAIIVALAVFGWLRGFVRAALGLTVCVAGFFFSFRLSSPFGEVVEAMSGVSPEMGRLIAGVLIFIVIAVAAAVLSRIIHKTLRVVPGLTTINRFAGAGFSVAAALAVITVVMSLLAVAPPSASLTKHLEGSALARFVTNSDGLPQKILGVVSGDRVIQRLLNLRNIGGSERLVYDGDPVVFEPVSFEELDIQVGSREGVLELLNRERVVAQVDPLVQHEPLAVLAESHAIDVYMSGNFDRSSSDGRSFDERFVETDLLAMTSDQVMAFAVSPEAAQEALFSQSSSWDVLTDSTYRKIGIAIVDGPMGVLLVEVLSS